MLSRQTLRQSSLLCHACRLTLRTTVSHNCTFAPRTATATTTPATPPSTASLAQGKETGYALPRPYTLPSHPIPPREVGHPHTDTAIPPTPTPAPAAAPAPKVRARRPRKAVLTLTADAVHRLRQIQSQDGKLIKISVVAKGCAGGAYRLDYLTPPAGKFDEVVEQDGVTVVVDSRSLMKVIGSVMDFQEDVLASRFVFENPNVVSTCGCEESFATKEDEERILGTGGKF